jgi:hypothetical protein
LILGSLWLFKRRIDVAAGLLLGLAMGIKIVPGILLLYFLWKREWKVVVWSIAGFALSLIITGGIAGGGIVGSYFFTQLLKYGGGLRPEVFNQSLNGFISRLFTYSEASNGWFYSPLTANILVKALSLVILGLSLYWTRGKTERSEFGWDLGFALFLSAMLIVSTWTMEHHLVFLYFPLLILLLGYIREQGISKVYAILSVLSFAIFAIDYPTESLKFNNGVLILIKSLKFYPLLIIWMITGLALVHKHKIAINRNKI